ncbi:MAG: GNAT family N-acetyltransferase [Lachnospiraceae bacterium]|nr:GNAT family N-acetyltransferase [Lachnospiraceae bacterium]
MEPCIIVGSSPDELRFWKERGFCVLVVLEELQSFVGTEREMADRITALTEHGFEGFDNVCIHAQLLTEREKLLMWQHHRGEPGTIGENDRILVRESMEQDAAAIREIYQDDRSGRFLEPLLPESVLKGAAQAEEEEAYAEYLRLYRKYQYPFYGYGIWSVVEKECGRTVGWAGLTWENHDGCEGLYLGYALLPGYWGRGLAREACLLILEFVMEQELADRVYVRIQRENLRSVRLAEGLRDQSPVELEIQIAS